MFEEKLKKKFFQVFVSFNQKEYSSKRKEKKKKRRHIITKVRLKTCSVVGSYVICVPTPSLKISDLKRLWSSSPVFLLPAVLSIHLDCFGESCSVLETSAKYNGSHGARLVVLKETHMKNTAKPVDYLE